MPAVRQIVRDAAKDDYRFSALVQGIATSVPMQLKIKLADSGPLEARAN
jgi:hypothetical protein